LSKEITIDTIEYLKKKTEILNELANVETTGTRKKKALIEELVELTEPILASGAIVGFQAKDLSVYLWNEIVSNNVVISHEYFIRCIPDNLKRKYPKIDVGQSHEHSFTKISDSPDGPIRKCMCSVYEIGGVIFEAKKETEQDAEAIVKEAAKELTKEEEREMASGSSITLGLYASKYFLQKCLDFIKAVEAKCRNPDILADFEKALEFKEVSKLMEQLEDLYDPQDAKVFYTKDEGEASILNQMLDETNFPEKNLCQPRCPAIF